LSQEWHAVSRDRKLLPSRCARRACTLSSMCVLQRRRGEERASMQGGGHTVLFRPKVQGVCDATPKLFTKLFMALAPVRQIFHDATIVHGAIALHTLMTRHSCSVGLFVNGYNAIHEFNLVCQAW
jgi:hypothetical protein